MSVSRLPLDGLTASLAVSVRLLRSSYAGPCLRVRRSSDNTEQDIGFNGTLLDTQSMLSFVGANDGFVVKWYDQSGSGSVQRVMTQSTSSKQPKIISSGMLVAGPGGRPGLDFDGTDDGLQSQGNDSSGLTIASLIVNSAYTAFCAFAADTISSSTGATYTTPFMFGDSGRYMGAHLQNSTKLRLYNWDGSEDYAENTVATATDYAFEARHEGGNLYAKVNNGAEVSAASGNTSSTGGTLFLAQNSSVYFDGRISELLLFNSALSQGVRDALSASVRNFHSIK